MPVYVAPHSSLPLAVYNHVHFFEALFFLTEKTNFTLLSSPSFYARCKITRPIAFEIDLDQLSKQLSLSSAINMVGYSAPAHSNISSNVHRGCIHGSFIPSLSNSHPSLSLKFQKPVGLRPFGITLQSQGSAPPRP